MNIVCLFIDLGLLGFLSPPSWSFHSSNRYICFVLTYSYNWEFHFFWHILLFHLQIEYLHSDLCIRVCLWVTQTKAHMWACSSNPHRPVVISFLPRRSKRPREGEPLARGHTTEEWHSWALPWAIWPQAQCLFPSWVLLVAKGQGQKRDVHSQ